MAGLFASARLSILVLVALAIVSCILSALALFAGHKEGFMETYDIVRINMTGFGQNIVPPTGNGQQDDGDTNILEDVWDRISDDARDTINDITGNIADEVADRLGISEWYSMHIMTVCEGSFTPNATAPDIGLNVSACRETAPKEKFNLTDMLDRELELGPLNLNLADLNWPPEIQDKLDLINALLLAIFILFVLTVGFTGLNVLFGVASFLSPESRLLLLINVTLAGLGMVTSVIAAVVVTVAVTKGLDELNKAAEDAGIRGERGDGFFAFVWVVAGLMLGAAFAWVVQLLAATFTDMVKSFVGDVLMPPISIILPLNRNIEEKFAVLKAGPNYNASTGYTTLHIAQDDGAVVLAYGLFIYQLVSFVMVGVALYGLAHLYQLVSHDPIIKHTKKCKYCRQRINAKAVRCVNCTSWLDGREDQPRQS
ncbi:Anditomin synthesis protein L [Paramyrothecium foliicola]|nr:Anditomin synthesis protein L [Paramyrothecium foliicola]